MMNAFKLCFQIQLAPLHSEMQLFNSADESQQLSDPKVERFWLKPAETRVESA